MRIKIISTRRADLHEQEIDCFCEMLFDKRLNVSDMKHFVNINPFNHDSYEARTTTVNKYTDMITTYTTIIEYQGEFEPKPDPGLSDEELAKRILEKCGK